MSIYKRPTQIYLSKNLLNPSIACWKQQHLRVAEIQKITKGKGAIITFLDDGLGQNTELAGRIINPVYSHLPNSNWFGEHSTNGATIIGGNSLGIFPEMQFKSRQVLDPIHGSGTSKAITEAIYASLEAGDRVLNMSLGSDDPDPIIEKAIKDFTKDGKRFIIIAAGNDANATDYPAAYAKYIKGVISVAATTINPDGKISIANFSSHGIITVAAPGEGLKTMTLNSTIDFVSGTSFAAPIVSGMIAVAISLNPSITVETVMTLLTTTSHKITSIPSTYQGKGEIDILSFLKKVAKK